MEPKGPRESRSAMIRFARAGPMRGRRTSDSAGAVSRSRGIEGVEVIDGTSCARLDTLDDLDDLDTLCSRAESTASICRRSAGWGAGPGAFARRRRTPAPRRATAEKKRRAWRSEGVNEGRREVPLWWVREAH